MLLSVFDSEKASPPYFQVLALGGAGAVGGARFMGYPAAGSEGTERLMAFMFIEPTA